MKYSDSQKNLECKDQFKAQFVTCNSQMSYGAGIVQCKQTHFTKLLI